ncbi:hypothetical protein CNMCM7927_003863 [Aspergillus lentulus]|nr:hypothetical protein CNMCM7927_003863 [Aspergillus lentulus]
MEETNVADSAESYSLAYLARSNLVREAARADYDLRVLIGHAAVLDSTTDHLTTREQESRAYSGLAHDISNGSEKRSGYGQSINISTNDTKGYDGSLKRQIRDRLKLEKELDVEFVLRVPKPTTPEGLEYESYSTEKTVTQLKEKAEEEADPEKKAKLQAQADGLAAEIQKLVTKMRSPKYKEQVKKDKALDTF